MPHDAAVMTAEEEQALQAKLQEMDRILREEMQALNEQEVSMYLERFNEALTVQEKMELMAEAQQQEAAELELQRRLVFVSPSQDQQP